MESTATARRMETSLIRWCPYSALFLSRDLNPTWPTAFSPGLPLFEPTYLTWASISSLQTPSQSHYWDIFGTTFSLGNHCTWVVSISALLFFFLPWACLSVMDLVSSLQTLFSFCMWLSHIFPFFLFFRTTFYFCFFLPSSCFFAHFWFLFSFSVFFSPCLSLFLPVFLPPLASVLRKSLLDRTDPSDWMHCSVGVKTGKLLNTGIRWQAVKLARHNTGFLKTSFS